MRDDSVGHIDGEAVAGIAGASLRDEDQVPGTIVSRARVRRRCKANEPACCRDQKRMLRHDNSPNQSRQTMCLSGRAVGRHMFGARPVADQTYGAFDRERLSKTALIVDPAPYFYRSGFSEI
jgi:hypothetical protein